MVKFSVRFARRGLVSQFCPWTSKKVSAALAKIRRNMLQTSSIKRSLYKYDEDTYIILSERKSLLTWQRRLSDLRKAPRFVKDFENFSETFKDF